MLSSVTDCLVTHLHSLEVLVPNFHSLIPSLNPVSIISSVSITSIHLSPAWFLYLFEASIFHLEYILMVHPSPPLYCLHVPPYPAEGPWLCTQIPFLKHPSIFFTFLPLLFIWENLILWICHSLSPSQCQLCWIFLRLKTIRRAPWYNFILNAVITTSNKSSLLHCFITVLL